MDEVLKEYGMRLLVNEETGVRMQLVSIIGEIEGHERDIFSGGGI